MTAILALALSFAVQDGEKDLTPEEAMRLLKEAQGLMERCEELLNDSSRGKALETEKEMLKRLEELLENDKHIMEQIQKLLRTTEKRQEDAIAKLDEIIRRAKSSSSSSSSEKSEKNEKGEKDKSKSQPNGGNPAKEPYTADRTSPPSKFRSEADRTGAWGDLPARVREAILHGARDIDEYPAEYREMIEQYMKEILKEKK